MNRWSIMLIFPLTRKMHELQSRPVCKSLSYRLRSTYVTFKFENISKVQPLQYTESRTKWLVPCRWHINMRFKTNVFIAISLNFVLNFDFAHARLLGTMAIFMPHYFLKIHQLKWAGNLKVSRGCMRSYEVRWHAKMEPLRWIWMRIGLNLVSEELNSPPSCSVMAARHLV